MKDIITGWVHNANLKIAKSPVGRYFRLEYSGHVDSSSPEKFQEVLTRFENSQKNRRELFLYGDKSWSGNLLRYGLHHLCQREHHLSQSGGTCVYPSDGPDLCDTDPAYSIGVQEINRDLVPATAAIAALTSFCMGLFANMRA